MKNFVSHSLSAGFGAGFVIVVLVLFDSISSTFPLYVPNIFYKERIDYYVNVESVISEAIEEANENVVGVTTFQDDTVVGTGSGVIYKLTEDLAYIVTNNHVVEDGTRFTIETTSGITKDATVIGTDHITDLAVITVSKGVINTHIEVSDSNALKVGEFVIAIGNPLGLTETSTFGIVSSINRMIKIDANDDGVNDWVANVIQTDAAINPGNSGGALINLDGKLVGINSMKIAVEHVEGIGFSIPSNLVMKIIADLEEHGKVERPFLGISYVMVKNLPTYTKTRYGITGDTGLYIHEVLDGSSADRQGLKSGDILLEVNDQELITDIDFTQIIYGKEVGESITMTLIRDGEVISQNFILESNLD